MRRFEQIEQLTRLVQNAVKRPPTSEEAAAYGSILTLCEMGKELEQRLRDVEAENARLKKQCAYLANDVIDAAQNYNAPMSDCRICDYARYCERKPGQCEPNLEMCEAAVLKSCDPKEAEK